MAPAVTPARHGLRVTDIHVHIQPWEAFRPETLARMRGGRPDFDSIERMSRDASFFLEYLDSVEVERAALINYPSPDIMGFGDEVNEFVTAYVKEDPKRLIGVGGVNPRFSKDPAGDVDRLADAGLRALKLHPPHMALRPEEYLEDTMAGRGLAAIYATASRRGLPIVVHTGTSVFPGARSRFGQPMGIDDVAVDFPDLKIIMAHGGRPLWTRECFFLMRRHPNLWLDLSGIPPKNLPAYFPRLKEIAGRTLFGTDWPSPGVRDIGANVDAFLGLPDSYLDRADAVRILQDNALELFPV